MALPFLQIFQPNQTIARLNDRVAKHHQKNIAMSKAIRTTIMISFGIFLLANIVWMQHLLSHEEGQENKMHLQRTKSTVVKASSSSSSIIAASSSKKSQSSSTASLRHYPPHRYYQLDVSKHQQQPDFLTTETEYIYGQWPILLPTLQSPTKLVVDQSEWLSPTRTTPTKDNNNNNMLPFADGTNPSILTVQRLQQEQVDPAILHSLTQHFPTVQYLATACMTDSQCAWNDSDAQKLEFHISSQTQPDTVRTVLWLLDNEFQSVAQATIYLERDAPWGRKMQRSKHGAFHLPALDDARLFLYANQIWISYREGKGFGYESQVLNPVHLEITNNNNSSNNKLLHVTLKASETTSFCCGRNMALLTRRSNNSATLQAVTWVDPVTVETVDTTPHIQQQQKQNKKQNHRRLSGTTTTNNNKHKSHIHGTNAFMVQVPSNNSNNSNNNNNNKDDDDDDDDELFLGVAHFHRPNDRKPNPYARFGHHYTHAFYTIRGNVLVGLSPEFVLPAAYRPKDAEIIQFVSGLEYRKDDDTIVLAYGINDCEAAVVTVEWNQVHSLLRPVPPGKQVVDFMEPLSILPHE